MYLQVSLPSFVAIWNGEGFKTASTVQSHSQYLCGYVIYLDKPINKEIKYIYIYISTGNQWGTPANEEEP